MHAAVVHSFDTPPRYTDFTAPVATGSEIMLEVVAAALHPRVRSAADGSHYSSAGALPMVPGVDGVGRTADGELRYFVVDDGRAGSMAEQVVVDRRRTVPLPGGTDPVAVAAAMNPAMSSWVALRRRIEFPPGGSVLVLGATGNAGRLAVQIARHLGAARVIGAGRDAGSLALLPALGADDVVGLGAQDTAERLGATGGEVDVVLDYLWGEVTGQAMPALLRGRRDRAKALSWIQLGSMAGLELTLPSYLLRAANLTVLGSGQGSVSAAGIVAELPALAAEITAGTLTVDPVPMPLEQVTEAWQTPTQPGRRIVLTP